MITPDQIDIAMYIIDSSGIVEAIACGMRTSKRGRKQNTAAIRLTLIGMFLSIHSTDGATLEAIWDTLTVETSLDDQVRLAMRTSIDAELEISFHEIRYFAKTYKKRLSYGPSMSTAGMNVADIQPERDRRHNIVRSVSNGLMDVFDLGWIVDLLALDATGVWSWEKDNAPPSSTELERLANDTGEPDGAESVELNSTGYRFSDATADLVAIDLTELDLSTMERVNPGDFDEPGSVDDTDATEAAQVKKDASWMNKTAKNGDIERFFGYFEHTLVQSPATGRSAIDLPPLIRRLEVTTAAEDVVAVSLRLIDSMPQPFNDLVVDRHYNYKRFPPMAFETA